MRRSERSGLDFAVLFSLLVSLEGVDHNVQAQNDQQGSQDQLQAVCDEHSAPRWSRQRGMVTEAAVLMALTIAIRRCTRAVKVTHSMMISGGKIILLLRP